MRVALIADIHGNLPALDAVLDEIGAHAPNKIVCLGDVASMGPFPAETLERVQALGGPVIMGNGDDAMLTPPQASESDDTARRFGDMDRWSAEALSDVNREFIRSFHKRWTLELPNDVTLLCVHGSPRSYDDVIAVTTPDDDVDEMLVGESPAILAGGHWHFQMLRCHKGTTLFNPGSVGLPYDVDSQGQVFIPSRAEYGMITAEHGRLAFAHRRIDYDIEPVLTAMRDRGFPHAAWWAANWR